MAPLKFLPTLRKTNVKPMKTEKEKMLAGELYIATDPELTAERLHAKRIIHRYNNLEPDNDQERQALLKSLVIVNGSATIEAPFRCDYGYNIEVGDGFFANYGCVMLDVCRITIGRNVLLGPGVHIYAATHPLDAHVRSTQQEYGKPVTIGSNVWVGGGTIICPGVTVGSNTTIGAGSVVTKDIPDNVLAAGNPCRVVRSLR